MDEPLKSSAAARARPADKWSSLRSTSSSPAEQDDEGQPSRTPDSEQSANEKSLGSRRALWGWLALCFSTGPTNGMINRYVTASIQSAANRLGHIPGTDRPCPRRSTNGIQCVVRFGTGEINYNSYNLYLQAISRACEGVISILTAGVADYANNRKLALMISIYVFGALVLPFAGLSGGSMKDLEAMAGLYATVSAVGGVYTVIIASYIPLFMRSVGWFKGDNRLEDDGRNPNMIWTKGTRVSVLGLVAGNVGSLTGLLVGVIITYAGGSAITAGYYNYLLAITVAGCTTIVVAALGHYLLPRITGAKRPIGSNPILLPLTNWIKLLRSVRRYPHPFIMCIGTLLWNTGYSNFLRLLGPLFLETSGLDSGSGVYTVWSFGIPLFASLGSLAWMFAFPRLTLGIKTWAYCFLSVQLLTILWGCLGINDDVSIGYKHQAEFWVCIVLFMSSGSALRALNRTLYASIIPRGSEALFFGLDITLDLATGWINPLVQGVIQDRTGNLRFPMIPNAIAVAVGIVFYICIDVSAGINDAKQLLVEDE
ncbi:Putative MFS transporter superfamily [Septoria linicola]|uniref:Autophagy-related protein n=1 Tax=Septoria linicola TaxID=215465 RepID=A0A9Q9B8Y9_9PEZI|nr:putative MFS transporter superfamily [Septoria linicola]USW59563.1 Putative MFS transporter superfamily [Septoria linicola]